MDDDVRLNSLCPSESPPPEESLGYGSSRLSNPPRSWEVMTLIAYRFFNPALAFAEQIDTGITDVNGKTGNANPLLLLIKVCGRGARTGLPGIYAFVN